MEEPLKLSWSSIKTFHECPKKFKLQYIDKLVAFESNEYTIFGNTVHEILENCVVENRIPHPQEFSEHFLTNLTKFASSKFFISLYSQHKKPNVALIQERLKQYIEDLWLRHFRFDLATEMFGQGQSLCELGYAALEAKFSDYEVVWTERELFEQITEIDSENEYNLKGFVDLVIRTKDGKLHIIDWKTTTRGWHIDKQRDPLTTYQLSVYKHFLCKKENLNPKNVETYFIFLKRHDVPKRVEILRMSSGERKKKNMFEMIEKVVYNVESGMFPAIGQNCRWCPFHKSKWCDK